MSNEKKPPEADPSAPTTVNPSKKAPADATVLKPNTVPGKTATGTAATIADATRARPHNPTRSETGATVEGRPVSDDSDAPITRIERMEKTPASKRKNQRDIDVGSVIRDRFVLQEVLGRGGMGAVYRALDLIKKEAGDQNPDIAIKLLTGSFKEHPHAFITLQREAKKTQELAHPNIVTVFDFDREEDLVYLTMEKLSGEPLVDITRGKSQRILNDDERYSVIEQIAKGLAYAHEKSIVHSDLKPANLFLNDDGTIKILDFGIARAANTELYQDSFDAGQLGALTLTYASPEMIRFESPHPSDDIYALGIIICELLNGVHPFQRKDAKTALESGLSPTLPEFKNPFLKKVVADTLALERDKRIPDAGEFLKRFNRARAAPKRIVAGLAIAVLAIAANFLYLQTIDVESLPFDALSDAQKTEFHGLLDESRTALRFNDFDTAVVKVNAAFEIHDNNKFIEKAREQLVSIFRDRYESIEDEKTRQFFEEQRENLREYPAFADTEF